MNSKLPFLVVALSSALLLSACGAQNADNSTNNLQDQNQTQNQNQNGQPNPSGASNQGMGPQIDYATAAEKLNVTEKVLKEALGVTDITPGATLTGKPSGAPAKMDLTTAAKKLNVTVEVLQEALGLNNNGGPQGGQPQDGQNPPSGTSTQN